MRSALCTIDHVVSADGMSSGAIVALQSALTLPDIDQLALYEPLLPFGHLAADNEGKPKLVATALRRYFGDSSR